MLNYARYFFMLFVVFIHCIMFIVLMYTNNDLLRSVGDQAFQMLHPASILAVISGYFYYSTFKMTTLEEFFKSGIYTKRLKRLIIPYLSWKVLIFSIFMITYILVNIFSKEGISWNETINHIRVFFISLLIFSKDLWEPMKHLGCTPHLWYIHNMFVMFLITPIFMHFKAMQYMQPFLVLALYLVFPQVEMILHFRFVLFFVLGSILGIEKSVAGRIFRFSIKPLNLAVMILAIYLANRGIKHFFHIRILDMQIGNTSRYAGIPNTISSLLYPTLAFLIMQCVLYMVGVKKDKKYEKSKHYMLYILHMYIIVGCIEALLLIPFFKAHQDSMWFVISAVIASFFITIFLNSAVADFIEKRVPKLQHYLI